MREAMTESGAAPGAGAPARVARLVLLGPPGAGKGTQAELLGRHLGVPIVVSGDLLRAAVAAGTELGRAAQTAMEAGELVPDELVARLVLDRLDEPDARDGFILDGFPRTLAQAERLDADLAIGARPLHRVLLLAVPDADLIARLLERGRQQQRADDRLEVIENRLQVYHAETEPLAAYYRRRGLLRAIDGTGPVEAVAARVLAALA
jgi:adenylate kinase